MADDASVDGALDVARNWLRGRSIPWTEIHHEKNSGLCVTLNDAIAVCRGRYVAIIAADDHWEPEKLRLQVRLLDDHPDAAVVYSDNYYMDADGERLDRIWHTEGLSGDLFERLLTGGAFGPVTTLIRRTALEVVGPYDEALVFEDWDMWLRLASKYPFVYSPYVSAVYRLQDESMSSSAAFRQPILKSSVRLLDKWIGCSRHIDGIVSRSLAKIGWRLYHLDRPAGRRVLWRSFRLHPSLGGLVRAGWATLRLPPNRYEALSRSRPTRRERLRSPPDPVAVMDAREATRVGRRSSRTGSSTISAPPGGPIR